MGRLEEIEARDRSMLNPNATENVFTYQDRKWLLARLKELEETLCKVRKWVDSDVEEFINEALAKLEASDVTVVRGNIEVTKTVTGSGQPVTYMKRLEAPDA